MAGISGQAIYVTNNTKEDTDSFEFGWELAKALAKPSKFGWPEGVKTSA